MLIGAVLGCQQNFDRFRPLCDASGLPPKEGKRRRQEVGIAVSA